MERYRGICIKMDEPSKWTVVFERASDGRLGIALAYGDNTPKQARTLTPEEAARFFASLDFGTADA